MKIFSSYRDYYDSALAYGHDDRVVYDRTQRHTVLLESQWPGAGDALSCLEPIVWSYQDVPVVKRVVLLFCGHRYLYWLDHRVKGDLGSPIGPESLLDLAGLADWLVEDERRKKRYWIEIGWYSRHDGVSLRENRDKFNKEAAKLSESNGSAVEYETFHAFQAPVLLLSRYPSSAGMRRLEVLTNPRLAPLGFVKIMDPFTALQSIETFIGSVLGRADEMPKTVGSDRILAQQKGFDEQSFRTAAPGAKKLNRRVNRARKRGG